jgi:hypothetical protein
VAHLPAPPRTDTPSVPRRAHRSAPTAARRRVPRRHRPNPRRSRPAAPHSNCQYRRCNGHHAAPIYGAEPRAADRHAMHGWSCRRPTDRRPPPAAPCAHEPSRLRFSISICFERARAQIALHLRGLTKMRSAALRPTDATPAYRPVAAVAAATRVRHLPRKLRPRTIGANHLKAEKRRVCTERVFTLRI